MARLGHEPAAVPCTLDLAALREELLRLRPDVVFNLVESLAEADSLVYLPLAVLDVLGLPYTGSRTEALFLTTHKLLAKQRLRQAGLPTPAWMESETIIHEGHEEQRQRDLTQARRRLRVLRGSSRAFGTRRSRGMDDDAVLQRRRCRRSCASGWRQRAARVGPALLRRAVHRRPGVQPLGAGRSRRAPRCFRRPRSTSRPSRPASRASWAIGRNGRPIRSSITTRPAASISTASDGPLLDELRRLAEQLLDAVRASRLGAGRFSGRCGRAAVDSGDQRQSLPLARRRLCRRARSRRRSPSTRRSDASLEDCRYDQSIRSTFRYEVRPDDRETVRRLVESTGVFSPVEVDVAVELVDDRLKRGPQSDYHFVFAELDGRTVGYTCYGPIALTAASFDLYWIAVDKSMHGRKIGRLLLEKTEELDPSRPAAGRCTSRPRTATTTPPPAASISAAATTRRRC